MKTRTGHHLDCCAERGCHPNICSHGQVVDGVLVCNPETDPWKRENRTSVDLSEPSSFVRPGPAVSSDLAAMPSGADMLHGSGGGSVGSTNAQSAVTPNGYTDKMSPSGDKP